MILKHQPVFSACFSKAFTKGEYANLADPIIFPDNNADIFHL